MALLLGGTSFSLCICVSWKDKELLYLFHLNHSMHPYGQCIRLLPYLVTFHVLSLSLFLFLSVVSFCPHSPNVIVCIHTHASHLSRFNWFFRYLSCPDLLCWQRASESESERERERERESISDHKQKGYPYVYEGTIWMMEPPKLQEGERGLLFLI